MSFFRSKQNQLNNIGRVVLRWFEQISFTTNIRNGIIDKHIKKLLYIEQQNIFTLNNQTLHSCPNGFTNIIKLVSLAYTMLKKKQQTPWLFTSVVYRHLNFDHIYLRGDENTCEKNRVKKHCEMWLQLDTRFEVVAF